VASSAGVAAGGALQVALGIIAYTRCDGVPLSDSRYPCPRDLRLEAQMRRVIAQLERCQLKPEQRGLGDLRLEFERGAPVVVSAESPRRGGFDRAAVSRCTGRGLADATTSLASDHMVVVYYFELR
jgi:hypothetical protein